MGRIFVFVGSGMSVVFTLVGMIVNLAVKNKRAALFGGQTLDQVLCIIGSVLLVGLAVGALLIAILGAGKLSGTKTIKGLGLVLAALPYFGHFDVYYTPWWFYILVGDLLIVLGGMAMEGKLLEEQPSV